MELRLRPLRIDDEDAARAAQAELAPEGFSFLLDLTRIARYWIA